jgi:hypothetical protein
VGILSRPFIRQALYVAAVLLIVAGVSLATVAITGRTQSAGGQYVKYTGTVPGLASQGVAITTIPATAPGQASTTPTALTLLVMGGSAHSSTYCANTCTAADFAQEVQYLVTAQTAAEGFELTVDAQAGSTTVSATVYFEVPATTGSKTTTNLGVYVDLTASSPITSFTATIQQCSSATSCP